MRIRTDERSEFARRARISKSRFAGNQTTDTRIFRTLVEALGRHFLVCYRGVRYPNFIAVHNDAQLIPAILAHSGRRPANIRQVVVLLVSPCID